MQKRLLNILLVFVILLGLSNAAFAAEDPDNPLPDGINTLRLEQPLFSGDRFENVERSLVLAQGTQQVVVRLVSDSVAEVYADQLLQGKVDLDQHLIALREIKKSQDQVLEAAFSLDSHTQILGQTQRVLNALILAIDASVLPELGNHPEVEAITSITDYELDLGETVPYIGASKVHELGYTGEGITVAVLDTGIDYTHAALGGSGDPAEYNANIPSIIEPGTFPTAKVLGGFDYVGGAWPYGSLAPDPDPLDAGPGRGHGTHVAHIIAGISVPELGIPAGVAPDVDLYALKVCSSITPVCSGIGLLNAMDFAADPNGDGRLDDAVDIINVSLGARYGNPYYDNLSLAVDQLSAIGVLTVAAAGNDGDKPYSHSTPASAPSALATAATNVPSKVLELMEVSAPENLVGFYPAVWQDWSAVLGDVYPQGIEAPLQYGDGTGNNQNGCDPFGPGKLNGRIILVDRGGCTFTSKILNIEAGGGLVGIIALVSPVDPFSTGWGGEGYPSIPAYMIRQSDAELLQFGLPDTIVRFDPASQLALVRHMTGYSARGPSSWLNYIKPEIGAPDASVSAVAGSGIGISTFGGTSGATPLVSGSAALLKDALLERGQLTRIDPANPSILKSILVTNGDTNIMNAPEMFGGDLAPITRIGGGEVRVDRAVDAPIALWETGDDDLHFPHLSFGQVDVTEEEVIIDKYIEVHNLTDTDLVYDLSASFRYQDDQISDAVQISLIPSVLHVPKSDGGKTAEANILVRMKIDGSKLADWTLNSGISGSSGDVLTQNEFDGYIWLDDVHTQDDNLRMIHIPWHILPRLSADITSKVDSLIVEDQKPSQTTWSVELNNAGIGTGHVNAYSWISHSPQIALEEGMGTGEVTVDLKDIGVATYLDNDGLCSEEDSFILAFAITTYDRFTHAVANPVFDIMIDVDQDGVFDYDVFNFDGSLNGSISDGRSVTWVTDLDQNISTAYFFLDHGTNSSNFVLTLCGEQIGMTSANFGDPMDIEVLATDWYYSGITTDSSGLLTISPRGERFLVFGSDIPPNSIAIWTVTDTGTGNQNEMGILFLLDAFRKGGVRGGAPIGNEAITLNLINP